MSIESPIDIFIRTTREGKQTKSRHRVWDVAAFMAAREADAAKERGKEKGADKTAKVEQISEYQYMTRGK
jgi:hypothetical protein